jgi:hypothetical protein
LPKDFLKDRLERHQAGDHPLPPLIHQKSPSLSGDLFTTTKADTVAKTNSGCLSQIEAVEGGHDEEIKQDGIMMISQAN